MLSDLEDMREIQNSLQAVVNYCLENSKEGSKIHNRALHVLKMLIGEDNSGGGSCGEKPE